MEKSTKETVFKIPAGPMPNIIEIDKKMLAKRERDVIEFIEWYDKWVGQQSKNK